MAATCLALGGCAGAGPTPGASTPPTTSATSSSSARATRLAQAQATHEYRSSPAPRQSAAGGTGSPIDAVRGFATAYINWTAQSVAAHMRALAAESVGQARSAMSLAAARTAQDYELQRGGISNRGAVEAIGALVGRRDQYAVITRELTTAANTTAYQGLRPAWHVTIATVTRLESGQCVLSGWQPEN